MKAGVDWAEVKRRYVAEVLPDRLSVRKLAKQSGVSHVTLLRRVEKEGWKPGTCAMVPSVPQATAPVLNGASPGLDGASDAIVAEVLQGVTPEVAARIVGVDPQELTRLREADPEFSRALDAVDAKSISAALRNLVAASDRGDTRATVARLQSHRFTKFDFGSRGGDGGPMVAIQLNIERGVDPKPPLRVVSRNR